MFAFGWLNFSAADMKRTKEAIAELKSQGSIDELGISIIRDGFADMLFPGLNVMQTSLKYFLLIPAMMHQIEKKLEIRENEDIQYPFREQLIDMECDFCDEACSIAPNLPGIIGKDSAEERNHAKRMVRFPHDIYWHGMDIFGLLPGNSSSMRSFCEGVRERKKITDDEVKRNPKLPWGDVFKIYNDVPLIPVPDPGNPEKTNPLALTLEEYDFLKKKILRSEDVKGTALETILNNADFPMLNEAGSAQDIRKVFCAFGDKAVQAADFGIFMRCAFLAYNIAYLMYCGDHDNKIAEYYKEIYELHRQVTDTIPSDFGFERKKGKTLKAMMTFHEYLRKGIPPEPQSTILAEIQEMMTDWENAAGKRLCHLKNTDPRPEKTEWIGMKYLDFRYNTAVRLFADYIGKGENYGTLSQTR